MASITIRDLDDSVKRKLRVRAAHHGRSMEEEARNILRTALVETPDEPENLAAAIRRRFAPLGGVEIDIPPREPMRKPPRLRR
ncbi:MAG: plasmid stabilization protein [Rhodospirillales bacterium]|nr:plasmid stabilization protein [Rhodospirillales bacterium]